MGPWLLSMCMPLAVAGILVAVACTQEAEGPVQSVAYYRSHPAEWERRVWVCTNEPAPSSTHLSAQMRFSRCGAEMCLSGAQTPASAPSHHSDAK